MLVALHSRGRDGLLTAVMCLSAAKPEVKEIAEIMLKVRGFDMTVLKAHIAFNSALTCVTARS